MRQLFYNFLAWVSSPQISPALITAFGNLLSVILSHKIAKSTAAETAAQTAKNEIDWQEKRQQAYHHMVKTVNTFIVAQAYELRAEASNSILVAESYASGELRQSLKRLRHLVNHADPRGPFQTAQFEAALNEVVDLISVPDKRLEE